MPDFSASSPLAEVSGKTFHAPRPWYYGQILDGTLKINLYAAKSGGPQRAAVF